MWHTNAATGLDPFFIQLDAASGSFRNAAQDFANYLVAHSFDLPEKDDLIKALHAIIASRIDRIDVAINNLKKILMSISKKLEDPQMKNALARYKEESDVFVVQSTIMLTEMNNLLERAIELHNKESL